MKRINLILKTLLFITVLFNFSCKSDERKNTLEQPTTSNKNTSECKPCKNNLDGSIETLAENDLSLKFDYNRKIYQMIHVDLLKDFILLAKPTVINKDSLQLKTKLTEIKNCEKLSLISSEYIKKCPNKFGIQTHHLKFTLKKIEEGSTRIEKSALNTVFDFKEGDNFDVHVFYEDQDNSLVLSRIPDKNCLTQKPVDDERICKTILSTQKK